MIAAGKFPRPIKLGQKASGFIESELDAWIDERIALRDGGR
jgi:prophage regulatory protein